ncbi:hypothetical protein GUJ93_ZPchr0015g6929 [Zizania palustris]|uniref:Uncharacterized protein n=1 Tax=Zizania palustris TaxID=103762 RepID=A0A8J5TB62_ZIZPA|nr:hypothetical protein GUJ93_ZPchr0015g6929 [Zizania palustris]
MAPPPSLAAMGRGEDWEAAVQDGGACPWRPRGARVHVVTGLPTAAAMSGAIDQSRHPGGRGSVRRELRAAGLRPASAGGLSRTAGGLTPPPVASRLRWPPSPAVDTHLRPRERQSGASSRAGGVDLRGVVPVAAPYRPPLPLQASVVSARGSGRRGLLAAGVRAAGFRPQIASAPSFPHAYVASPPPLPIPGRLTVALLHADVLFPAVPPPTSGPTSPPSPTSPSPSDHHMSCFRSSSSPWAHSPSPASLPYPSSPPPSPRVSPTRHLAHVPTHYHPLGALLADLDAQLRALGASSAADPALLLHATDRLRDMMQTTNHKFLASKGCTQVLK